jgi:hypothetical protein
VSRPPQIEARLAVLVDITCRCGPPEMTAQDSFPWETKDAPIRANAADGYAHSSDNVWHYTAPFAPGTLVQARRLAQRDQ